MFPSIARKTLDAATIEPMPPIAQYPLLQSLGDRYGEAGGSTAIDHIPFAAIRNGMTPAFTHDPHVRSK
ncbi:hypothetical protein EAH79_07425 [Sphingomonas koreensis]|nr:hypothetical protein EAH79_07425 [Sphingomonas koreensis]